MRSSSAPVFAALVAVVVGSLAFFCSSSAAALPTVIVVDGASTEWAFLPEGGSPIGYFALGPSGQPYGPESALLATDETADGLALISQELVGTRLDAFLQLSYWTHVDLAPQAPALQFSVDYDETDGDSSWQGRLVFEPSNAGTVTAGTWQEWDTLSGEWWATGEPGKTTCPQSDPCTWTEVLTAFPDAAVHGPSLGQFLVKAGSGWSSSHVTYVDGIRVETTGGVDVVYDFEATSAQVNTSELSENGWFSDDTRADGTAVMPEAVGTDLVSPMLTDDPEASSGDATVDHDDDILSQIDFVLFGPPVAPPDGEWPGAVHLTIADAVNDGKSQISHRNNPDVTGDADGFGYGHEILNAVFSARYSWMADNTSSPAITGALKLAFKTTEYPGAGLSSRTGEDAWDKLLVYEPGNGNGGSADGTWQSETVLFSTGKWWIVDRGPSAGITIGDPMTLAEMETSTVAIGGRTVADVWDVLTDADPGEEAVLTSIQLGVGSFNAGASLYVNQLETSFYRKGMVTTFGFDPAESVVVCVPSAFDPRCETTEATIQDALDLAGLEPQDVILVDAGNYVGDLVAPSSVQLAGAGEGISGCGRSIAESVVFGSLQVDATDVVVEGFTFVGTEEKLSSGAAVDRLVVRNNRFLSGEAHVLFEVAGGDDVTIEDNELVGDPPTAPEPGGSTVAQLMARADLPGLYVTRNCFSTSEWPAITVENATVAPSGLRPPVISGNSIEDVGGGLDASTGRLDQLEFSANALDDFGAFGIRGQLVGSLVFDNVFRGATGDGVEISENQATASPGNAAEDNAVLLNCFFQNGGSALRFSSTQAAGTMATNFARFNDLVANGAGATYAGAESLDVTSNYWGAADGPSGDGPGSGDAANGATLEFDPFLAAPSTVGTPCDPEADLAITKEDDVDGLAVPGDPIVYSIRVENLGPFDAAGAAVVDPIPSGLAACTWTCAAEGAASCGAASGSGDLADVASIPAGDAVVYELSCTVESDALQVDNTATVTAGDPEDPDASNNSARVVVHTVDAIFSDGFESGDASAWTLEVP